MNTLLTLLKTSTIPHVLHSPTFLVNKMDHVGSSTTFKSVDYAVIPEGTRLYRSGENPKPNQDHLPMFYSSWQVAATYAQEKQYFNTFVTTRPLKLLHVSPDTLDFLIEQYIHPHTDLPEPDRVKLFDFVSVFGYRLPDLFTGLSEAERAGTTAIQYFTAWANRMILADSHIVILPSYGNTLFNRISISKQDKKVFAELFTITHPEIVAFLHDRKDGIYAPNMTSGMFNMEHFLTAEDEFPEEVFLREELVVNMNKTHTKAMTITLRATTNRKRRRTSKKITPQANTNPTSAVIKFVESLEYVTYSPTSIKSNERILESYCTRKTDDELFTFFSPESITRIYLYTFIYKKIASSIQTCLQNLNTCVHVDGCGSGYKRIFLHFKDITHTNLKYLMLRTSNIIDVAFVLDVKLL